MSKQKSPNIQKMGISLQLTEKPTLLQCDISCYECYAKNPDGFYCGATWKIITIPIFKIPCPKRKTTEDFFLL